MSSAAGGVFRMNVHERSSKSEISTGMTVPTWSCVRALYSLQNIMMLTPAAPRAGPTGGAGLALPAANASLMILDTFLAIIAGSVARFLCTAAVAHLLLLLPADTRPRVRARRALLLLSALNAGACVG